MTEPVKPTPESDYVAGGSGEAAAPPTSPVR